MARLGDVVAISPSVLKNDNEQVWLLNLDMVEQNTGNILAYNYVPREELTSSIIQFDTENVLYSKLRPNLNKVVLPLRDGYATSEMLPLRPDTNAIYREYLATYLRSNSFVTWAVSKTIGAKMPRLSTKDLLNKDIPLPSLTKQRQIVTITESISKLICLYKKQRAKLDGLVKARFVEMFGDCQNTIAIGEAATICRGASPRPITEFVTDSPNGVNWIKIGDVSNDSLYITHAEEKITPEGAIRSRVVHKGDFILSNSMSFGRPYILGIDGCVHDGWLILSDFRDTFHELYLYHALRSEFVQHQFRSKVNGVTVKNLNSDLVRSTYIKLPSDDLQNQFADFAAQVEKTKAVVQSALGKAQLLFDSLMQKYFG